MIIYSAASLNPEINLALPMFCVIICVVIGRECGYTIDLQYREPEGKPCFVIIPDRLKWLFHFRYFSGAEVVKEGFIIQLLGYISAFLELLLLFSSIRNAEMLEHNVPLSFILLFVYFVITLFGYLIPMHLKYERNMQKAYDCDWITRIQENLSIYPKRRCYVVTQIDHSTYMIRIGGFFGKEYLAKSQGEVSVGTRKYAVHSKEAGSPFWTIKYH